MTIDQLRQRYAVHQQAAEVAYITECFGDQLAATGKVPSDLRGREAIDYYLISTHSWLPAQVRALSWEEIQAVLHAELSGWTLSRDARAAMGR